MTATTTERFVSPTERHTSLWVYACQLQMAERDWREIADAWATVALAWPPSATEDVAIFWHLAGRAARRALGTR